MNSVFASFYAEIKLSLLQKYCASWYVCQAWHLGTPYCDIINVEWQKAVRWTAGLPRHTRGVLLPGMAGNEKFSFATRPSVCQIISCHVCKQQPYDLLSCHQCVFYLLLEFLVVTEYTLQTRTSVVDSAKARLSLLGAGPFPMKLPARDRFVSWCVPGKGWRQLKFSNLRISHWCLSS